MKKEGKLHSDIVFPDFNALTETISGSDRIYVAIPMGTRPEGELQIHEAWQKSAKPGATLTHVQGMPATKMLSAEFWAKAALEGYIAPEQIEEARQERITSNRGIASKTQRAFDLIASIRSEGRQVHETELREREPSLFESADADLT